jgi:hypothetical protein
MARLLFHSDGISERGTTTSIIGYMSALLDEGHEITWVTQDVSINDAEVINRYSNMFNIEVYKNFREFHISAKHKYDWAYFMKKGENDGKIIEGVPSSIHSVFKYYQPHGDVYAYISKWLANSSASLAIPLLPTKVKNRIPNPAVRLPWVPYGVDLPNPTQSLRSEWGIPEEAKLILRYGGRETFDIPWVLEEVIWQLTNCKDFYFVGVNTEKFTSHPRAIFLPTVYSNIEKANMLSSADVVLHGRLQGESFGMVILEAMQAGKEVLSWNGGWDRNHVKLLAPESLYRNQKDLRRKLSSGQTDRTISLNLAKANEYRISSVMPRFKKVFGQGVL